MSGHYSHTHTRTQNREKDVKGLSGSPNTQRTDLRQQHSSHFSLIKGDSCESMQHPHSKCGADSSTYYWICSGNNTRLLIAFIWHWWWLIVLSDKDKRELILKEVPWVLCSARCPTTCPTFNKKVPSVQKNRRPPPAASCHKQQHERERAGGERGEWGDLSEQFVSYREH